MNNRLYFITEITEQLVEYDLDLLAQFIQEKMEYKPRVMTDDHVSDIVVRNSKEIWTLGKSGEVKKLKSLLGKRQSNPRILDQGRRVPEIVLHETRSGRTVGGDSSARFGDELRGVPLAE